MNREKGIQSGIHYPTPLTAHPHIKDQTPTILTRREDTSDLLREDSTPILSLPIYPGMTAEQVSYTTTAIKSFFERKL